MSYRAPLNELVKPTVGATKRLGDAVKNRTGGSVIVEALEANDVEVVFGVPGTHNLEIYRGLSQSSIRHVLPRHEQGAGYAADGYARLGQRPGVCITTSGPGLTNIATAVATAYADSVPMLVIAPGVPRGCEGSDAGWLHEVRDQRSMMGSLVQRAVRVSTPDEAAVAVHEAFAEWRCARPRPAYIEVPVDVLEQPWPGTTPVPGPPPLAPTPDYESIKEAARILVSAERPVVVVGGGARCASRSVLALVELLSAATLSSVNGKGILSETHELSLGASLRLRSAQHLIEGADVVLLVGTELGDSDLWGCSLALSGTVIRVDIDEQQLNKNAPASVGICGDAEVVLDLLISRIRTTDLVRRDCTREISMVRSAIAEEAQLSGSVWKPIQDALRSAVTGDVVVAGDSAQVSYYGTVHYWPMGPADRFLYPTGYATLGYGLPAAIGAKIAEPNRETIVLVGDGGFMFSCQELVTAVELEIGLPVIVINNGGFREIRDEMIGRGIEPLGVDLVNPDFAALSRAIGGHGLQLEDLDQLADVVRKAFSLDAPTVIEFRV